VGQGLEAPTYEPTLRVHGYGGFWRRFTAAAADAVLINVLVDAVLDGVRAWAEPPRGVFGLRTGVKLVVAWLYVAGMECSPLQASIGKLALGLRVTDLQGGRVSFGRATLRHWSKLLSGPFTLGLGYLMIAFSRRKQALHDRIAGCLVVRRGAPAGPIL
jgi:uncharacterized RDD family membrane protein YckC